MELRALAQQACSAAGAKCGGAKEQEPCPDFAALPFSSADLDFWPDAYSVDSMPSVGSLSGLPSMSMSFDLQLVEGTAAALGEQVPEHTAQLFLPNDSRAPAAKESSSTGAVNTCENMPAHAPTVPPNLPSCHPPSNPQVHPQPTAIATATATATTTATATATATATKTATKGR